MNLRPSPARGTARRLTTGTLASALALTALTACGGSDAATGSGYEGEIGAVDPRGPRAGHGRQSPGVDPAADRVVRDPQQSGSLRYPIVRHVDHSNPASAEIRPPTAACSRQRCGRAAQPGRLVP